MASTVKTFSNNNPPSCEDEDLNGFKLENNNLIVGSGQSLSTADNQQTHKAVSAYAASGDFYTDSGIANAYVLSTVGAKVPPPEYADGMRTRFDVANPNAGGASTINVAGLGVKPLTDSSGNAPDAGRITGRVEAVYNLGADRFEIGTGDTLTASVLSGRSAPVDMFIFNTTVSDITMNAAQVAIPNRAIPSQVHLASTVAKAIDTSVVGAGGIDAGAVAIDTLYDMFYIYNGSTVSTLFATEDKAGIVWPSGYDSSRFAGTFKTDGSGDIVKFFQGDDDLALLIDSPPPIGVGAVARGINWPSKAKSVKVLGGGSGTSGHAASFHTISSPTPVGGYTDKRANGSTGNPPGYSVGTQFSWSTQEPVVGNSPATMYIGGSTTANIMGWKIKLN